MKTSALRAIVAVVALVSHPAMAAAMPSDAGGTVPSTAASCLACHNSPARSEKPPVDCLSCHKRLQEAPLYGGAGELRFSVREATGKLIPRFTDSGLRRYLRNPMPRRGGTQGTMAPVPEATIEAILRDLQATGQIAKDDANLSLASQGSSEQGAQIYGERCAACHASATSSTTSSTTTSAAAAPSLRFGYPLLGFGYFAHQVRHGGGGMPPQQLDDTQIAALYRFVTAPKTEKSASTPYLQSSPRFGSRLYDRIMKEGLGTSCRHCHIDQPEVRQEMVTVFGAAPREFFLENSPGGLRPSRRSRSVLEPGPDCSDSVLVQRLAERHREWRGESHDLAAGMPLTVPPLPPDVIDDIRRWSRAGCPSPAGSLCTPCR